MSRNLIARLHRDHERLAHVLEVLERVADGLGDPMQPDEIDMLANIVDYVVEYPDAVHHPLEDRVFSRLLQAGLSETQRTVVETNVEQHVALLKATQTLARDIETALDADTGSASAHPTSELKAHVVAYTNLQREHMSREEHHLFPLAEQVVQAEDWDAIEREEREVDDPLFDQRLTRFDSIYQHIVEGRSEIGAHTNVETLAQPTDSSGFSLPPRPQHEPSAPTPIAPGGRLRDSQTAHPDSTAAGYLANREFVNNVNGWMELTNRIGEIQRRQFEWWMEDSQEIYRRLAKQEPFPVVMAEYWKRRAEHGLTGASELMETWAGSAERAATAQRLRWSPFRSKEASEDG